MSSNPFLLENVIIGVGGFKYVIIFRKRSPMLSPKNKCLFDIELYWFPLIYGNPALQTVRYSLLTDAS